MGYKMRDAMPGKSFFYSQKQNSLQEVADLIKNRYVDTVNINAITDTAIIAMLSKLDPHSAYIPAAELQDINDDIKGSFFGLGIEYNIINDSLNIVHVLPNGPAEKAGLQTGDVVLKAGDSTISGKPINQYILKNIFRGGDGSKLTLVILRNASKLTVTVTRGNIPVKSIDVAYMLNTSIGYIKINKFTTQTYKEFMNNLLTLKQQKMTSLVLDLRGNGGGVLDEATEVVDELLAGDKLITYTQGTHSEKKEIRCRRQGQFEQGKVVILADENTASASEVLMGALQDWDRATILGRQSFGKGLVQEQYDLSNQGALRLTIARYFTPLGRSIQRPYKLGNKAYFDAYINRYYNGQNSTADSIKNDTSKVYKTTKGKKLYAAGGITPDYFISTDTSKMSKNVLQLFSKGLLNDFGYRYIKQNKTIVTQYKTANIFIKNFVISPADWQYFNKLAIADSITNTTVNPTEKTYIQKILKASIAKQLFNASGYYQTLNDDDNYIKKALELLK